MKSKIFPTHSYLLIVILSLISVKSGAQLFRHSATWKDTVAGITVMTTDPDHRKLIYGDSSGYLCMHDLNSGLLTKKLKVHFAPVNTLAFNSNGKLLISSTADGEIKIFDFEKDKIVQSIFSPDYSGIRFVLFSIADGFIYFNGVNRLYKTRSDLTQPVEKVLEEKDTLYDAVITRDRSSLIYTTGNYLKVLNTRSDIVIQQVSSGASAIERLALVRDTLLASWSKDGTINFWNYAPGQLSPAPRFWFKAGIPAPMNFSPDGSWMISGNIGSWARVWKPFERSVFQELFGHQGTVTSSAFGIDTNAIYTGSSDGSVMTWNKSKNEVPLSPPKQVATQPVIQEPIHKPVPSPDVVINEANIPTTIKGRKVNHQETIEVHDASLTIFVYDNSFVDGDTMSLFFNGEWLLDHYGVTKTKKAITLNFFPNTNNYLVLFANNLGRTPPNTAAISFKDGNTPRVFKLESDLRTCSAMNFFYRK